MKLKPLETQTQNMRWHLATFLKNIKQFQLEIYKVCRKCGPYFELERNLPVCEKFIVTQMQKICHFMS